MEIIIKDHKIAIISIKNTNQARKSYIEFCLDLQEGVILMYYDLEKLEKTRTMLETLIKGVNPLTGAKVEKASFVNDAQAMRFLNYGMEVMQNLICHQYSRRNKNEEFKITQEEKQQVKLPEGKIGVNEFSRCVNLCIDPLKSKMLTGVELNRKLKKLKLLGEESTPEGKTRTILNSNSEKYGFESERRTFRGAEYEMIVINDIGKKYLIDNLESIMAIH